MTSRQPPHSFPNHQIPQTSQSQAYPPPASQPQAPIHVPFAADPYSSRRDPFAPSAQHARRSSFGIQAGDAPGGYRNTDGFHHASLHHPPPLPSMNGSQNTHMPPPTSPQQQHNHASQAQHAPFSSNFGGRELPGIGLGHRPGSSMSISAIIGGGDTGALNQTSQSQSSPPIAPTNAPPSNHHTMQPPSPRRGLASGSRPEFQPYRRQPSPDRPAYAGNNSRLPEGHGYLAGSPVRSYNAHGSPELGRQSLAQAAQPYKPMIFQGSRPYAPSTSDAHARDPRQPSASVPPRPNSQPNGPHMPPEQETRTHYEAMGGRRTFYGQTEERRRTLGESHHSRPNVTDILGTAAQSSTDKDRPVTVEPLSQSAFSPPRDPRNFSGPNHAPRSLWRHAAPEDAPQETTEIRREEQPTLYRGYGGYPASSQGPPPYRQPAAEDMVRGRSLDHLNNRVVEQYHAPPTSDPHSSERLKAEQLSRSLSSGANAYPRQPPYDQSRKFGDELHNKSLLALGPEANRRTGRASPLPQAVQGAQAQPVSVGKDPGIKSEFGRMFSGLGSGLGSSTPSRQSPMPQGASESLPLGVDFNELKLQRVSSQNGRKPKRVKDEEGALDNESIDGRGTPSGRGGKRNKHNHPGHHHHHHAHAHHHHHHHHKLDDDVIPQVPPATTTPFNGRYTNPPSNGASAHHHHHYHAPPHHHHHPPRSGQPVPLPPPQISARIHDIQAVLDEAAKYPRYHLGSYLYEAIPELPKANSQLDDQFCYASKPKRLPLFERNPVNCVVTCRVHRYYLKPRQRQQIVLQRHLWGARLYRDDSDPIAAAIHSGWIRGEWDDTVDVSMLDPRITAPNHPSDAEDTLSKLPAAPVTPPAEMELQIDLLILPRIEKYEDTVEYGISSRKSSTHDGLSFMIHQIRWVEEGIGTRGQERTAAAMKRRLDASTALLSLTTGGRNELRAVNETAKLHA